MRVLMVSQTYYPFLNEGGPPVKVRSISRHLIEIGHQVGVLTADLGLASVDIEKAGISLRRQSWGWEGVETGIEGSYLTTLARWHGATLNPSLFSWLRTHLKDYDIVHIYGLYDTFGAAAGAACRRRRIPYVIEPIGMFRPISRSLGIKKLYHALWGRKLLGGAQKLIATADQERDEFVAGHIPVEQVVVRRNGLDIPSNVPLRGAFRSRMGIHPEALVVLFLGRLVPKKGPDLLIKAFLDAGRTLDAKNALGGARKRVLVLAGPQEIAEFASQLKSLAKETGPYDQILFPGPLFNEDKWAAYHDADVFVLPSQNENFGNTVAEAAACDCPVIVSQECGISQWVGGAGLVTAYDRAAVSEALVRVLGDEPFRRALQANCRSMALALSWDEPIRQMEAIYTDSLSRRSESR